MRARSRGFGLGRLKGGGTSAGPDRPGVRRRRVADEQPFESDGPDMRRGGELPLGIVRWRARAQARRTEIERQLFDAPLNPARREALKRWLRNLESREAWQAARLEHTVALKKLVGEALDVGPPAASRRRSMRLRPKRDAAEDRGDVDSLAEEPKDR